MKLWARSIDNNEVARCGWHSFSDLLEILYSISLQQTERSSPQFGRRWILLGFLYYIRNVPYKNIRSKNYPEVTEVIHTCTLSLNLIVLCEVRVLKLTDNRNSDNDVGRENTICASLPVSSVLRVCCFLCTYLLIYGWKPTCTHLRKLVCLNSHPVLLQPTLLVFFLELQRKVYTLVFFEWHERQITVGFVI